MRILTDDEVSRLALDAMLARKGHETVAVADGTEAWRVLGGPHRIGAEMAELRTDLARRVKELEVALAQVKRLQGLMPICSYCKKVRDDHKYWQKVGDYLLAHSEIQVNHGICPACWEEFVKPEYQKLGLSAPDECPE